MLVCVFSMSCSWAFWAFVSDQDVVLDLRRMLVLQYDVKPPCQAGNFLLDRALVLPIEPTLSIRLVYPLP